MDPLEPALRRYFETARPRGIVAAYLFGSRARGAAHRESDVDVAVLFERAVFADRDARAREAVRLATNLIGATHENHHHPNAEEVVMVVQGRGTQIVGDDALDVEPGDICFIPRSTPHRITGTSEEDLVILWAFGGAASIEQAGYVPLPD